MVSPILVFVVSGYIFYGYVIQQKNKNMVCFGWLLTLSIFSWFVSDLWWGIQTLILHSNPRDDLITAYGYFVTNLLLFLAVFFTGYQDLKKMNKIQAMLDTLIVSICMAVLLWLFVFEQSNTKVLLLLSDPISMASLVIDVIIYAWINVWIFSTRLKRPPLHHLLLVAGGLMYVITDFIYFYIYFYSNYEPNSWIDGAYMISFAVMAISAYVKGKLNIDSIPKEAVKNIFYKFEVEIFILFIPIVVLIFKRSQLQYFILLVVALLIYYVLINFTQKSIFQEKLLELEKENVLGLERKVEERTEEIIKILNTDFVSGLYSRRFFETLLSETLNKIEIDQKIALLYIDLNKSKAIKYIYGKETSDNLVKKVAEAISFIATENFGIIASYGDDAFVIMLIDQDADLVARKTAEQIIEQCSESFYINNYPIRVSLNIGISCFPTDTTNANDLIKNADIAMMQAKAKGYNRIQLYNDKIGKFTYNRHRIELKLKKVIFDNEFLLYYQPQVYCMNGTVCGFETLIRWFDEEKKFISPSDFIPVAEEIGLIIPLGYWIIENAAKQLATWKKETGNDYRIAVNVSSKQLMETDFVQRLHNTLKRYDILPETFEIEITESQEIEHSIEILETLKEINKLGVLIAIDDFGTGYSSLNYLKNIPVDRIKIAKELIDKIEDDVYSSSIIQMAINIAKVKGIKVIAEGVETKEQWECLKSLGCDEIQGYYFAKPMPAKEIVNHWIG